jgi:hypothetical protein
MNERETNSSTDTTDSLNYAFLLLSELRWSGLMSEWGIKRKASSREMSESYDRITCPLP